MKKNNLYFIVVSLISFSALYGLSSCASSPTEVNEHGSQGLQFSQPMIDQPVSGNQTAIPVNSALPIANRVAGRPGFVFNPYNQNMVEVNGVLSGAKVRDPQDPNPSHIFIVP